MTSKQSARHIYKVIFLSQGKLYELYARRVGHGELYGFVEVEELIFGDKNSVVVDPSEERLRTEFAGVRASHIPIHAVVRIDEVEKEGVGKISDAGDKVTAFPGPPVLPPRGKS